MKKPEHKKVIEQICDFMGEDIDSPACRAVADHFKECSTCRIYFDTVKKTVTLCRELEDDKKMPEDVHSRLFKVLNLDEIKKANK